MTQRDDLIRHALQAIAATWRAAPAQTVWEDNGFTWTPGSHLVRVHAFDQGPDDESARLIVETSLLDDVPLDDGNFQELVAMCSGACASTYALVYPPSEVWAKHLNATPKQMTMQATTYVDAATLPWMPTFLARMALMQPIDAEIRAAGMAKVFAGGVPAYATGARADVCDEVLETAHLVYRPMGEAPSAWTGCDEFARFAEAYGRTDVCYGQADADRLTFEVPFGDTSALIQLCADQKHPQLGHGLLVSLTLPHRDTLLDVAGMAARLNWAEAVSWTGFPQFGCWHARLDGGDPLLAHVSFIPNTLYRRGLAIQFAFWSVARADYARKVFWPEFKNLTMPEILEARMGGLTRH